MTLAATSSIKRNGSTKGPGLIDQLVRYARSMFKSKEPIQIKSDGFREVLPYGFVSRNYISYMSKAVPPDQVSELSDGTRICRFNNGGVLLNLSSGHIVELDRQGRVVLLRALSSELDPKVLQAGDESVLDLKAALFQNSRMDLPGGISVTSVADEVHVLLPTGTIFSQPIVV
jgi:hypothetical protein